MKYFLVALIAAFAFSVQAAPKKPCKEGQTEADGCHVVKKAEKVPPAKKKPDEKKPGDKKPDEKK